MFCAGEFDNVSNDYGLTFNIWKAEKDTNNNYEIRSFLRKTSYTQVTEVVKRRYSPLSPLNSPLTPLSPLIHLPP